MVLLHSHYLYTHVAPRCCCCCFCCDPHCSSCIYSTFRWRLAADVCKQHSIVTVCLRARTGFSSFSRTFNLLAYIVCLFPSVVPTPHTGRCFVVTHGSWIDIDFERLEAEDREIIRNEFQKFVYLPHLARVNWLSLKGTVVQHCFGHKHCLLNSNTVVSDCKYTINDWCKY